MKNCMQGNKQHRRTHETTKLIKNDTFHSGKTRRNRGDESKNRAAAGTHCLQQRGSKHALSSAMCVRYGVCAVEPATPAKNEPAGFFLPLPSSSSSFIASCSITNIQCGNTLCVLAHRGIAAK